MEFDELQAKFLELEENYNNLVKESSLKDETIISLKAENGILRDNNQKLFERTTFAEPQKEEEKKPPKPQGLEAIKNLFKKEGNNG